jgi:hypothetical protein
MTTTQISAPYTVGDTFPNLTGTVSADLTGATLSVHVARPDGTVFSHAATAVSPTAGTWTMAFSAGDISLEGVYRVEVEVTFSNGKVQTFTYDTDGRVGTFYARAQFA